MAENEFTIRASMNKEYLPLKYEMKNLVLMVEVRARSGTKIKEFPKNICFVIDKSSSMEGAKIKLAKAAIKETIKSLSSSDIVSVVVFSSEASIVLESSTVKDKELLANKIEEIELGTMTNLYDGIETGLGQLRKNANKNRLNKMYILTDGETNVGKIDPEDFKRIALQIKEHKISVDTFGIGANYNENILSAISNNSMGEWVHISDVTDVNKKVMDHVTKLKSVIYSSPILILTLVNITNIYDIKRLTPSVRKISNIDRKGEIVKFPIGDIDALESQTFYMRIDTKVMNDMGRHPVVNIQIEGVQNSMITQNAIWTDDVYKLRLENKEIRAWDTLNKTIIKGLENPDDDTISEDLYKLKTEIKGGPIATVIKETETKIKTGDLEDVKKLKYGYSTVTSTTLKKIEEVKP